MPDIGASAVRTLESSIHVATTITKLSKEVLLAVLKLIREQMNSGQVTLKQLNKTASKNGIAMTSVSLPDKDAQAIINDLKEAGVTFAVKRENDGIRLFFYAPSTEIIKAAIDDALKKHSKEQEQPQKEEQEHGNKDAPTQENPTPEQEQPHEQQQPTPETEQPEQQEQKPPEQETSEPETPSHQQEAEEKQPEQPPPEQKPPEQEEETPPQQEQEEQPPQEEEKQEEQQRVPLYRQSVSYAKEHGEVEAYRSSMMENIACRDTIEKVISEHFDGMHLPKAISHDVVDRFGIERVGFVLAATVVQNIKDFRFSVQNRQWAEQEAPDLDPNARRYRVQSHPGVLNLFINDAREYFAQVKQNVIGIVENAAAFSDHSKIVREGEEVPTPDNPKPEDAKAAEQAAPSQPEKTEQKEQKAESEPEFASFEDLMSEGVKLSKEHNEKYAGQQRPTPDRKREQTL